MRGVYQLGRCMIVAPTRTSQPAMEALCNCLRANKKEAPAQVGMARNSKSTRPKHSALRKAKSSVQTSSDQYALAPTVERLTGEEAVVLGSMKNWKASNDRRTYASERQGTKNRQGAPKTTKPQTDTPKQRQGKPQK